MQWEVSLLPAAYWGGGDGDHRGPENEDGICYGISRLALPDSRHTAFPGHLPNHGDRRGAFQWQVEVLGDVKMPL